MAFSIAPADDVAGSDINCDATNMAVKASLRIGFRSCSGLPCPGSRLGGSMANHLERGFWQAFALHFDRRESGGDFGEVGS